MERRAKMRREREAVAIREKSERSARGSGSGIKCEGERDER